MITQLLAIAVRDTIKNVAVPIIISGIAAYATITATRIQFPPAQPYPAPDHGPDDGGKRKKHKKRKRR